jgi:hypothetical protein
MPKNFEKKSDWPKLYDSGEVKLKINVSSPKGLFNTLR